MSWANRLTLLRVLLIPFFLLFMYLQRYTGSNAYYLYAAIVFFVASMTDILDGYLARREKKVTVFGKVFDPIADKLLVLSALVILTEDALVPSIISIFLIAREILISGFRIVMAKKGEVISASWLGKTKTTLQDVAIILILLGNCGIGFFNFLNVLYLPHIAMGGAIVFTLWSTVDYFLVNKGNFSTGE
jgi:CDP-diacylglycerol---glycerol-3-phosphate 3-phosphatidyltransferase